MIVSYRKISSRVYSLEGVGRSWLVFPDPQKEEVMELSSVFSENPETPASVVFSSLPSELSPDCAEALAGRVFSDWVDASYGRQAVIWLEDPRLLPPGQPPLLQFRKKKIVGEACIGLPGGWSLNCASDVSLSSPVSGKETGTWQEEGIYFLVGGGSEAAVFFLEKLRDRSQYQCMHARICLSGESCGCLRFEFSLSPSLFFRHMRIGTQFVYPEEGDLNHCYSLWMNIFNTKEHENENWLHFDAFIDPADLFMDSLSVDSPAALSRTAFYFASRDGGGEKSSAVNWESRYEATNGLPLRFAPSLLRGNPRDPQHANAARLVFARTPDHTGKTLDMTPSGDFSVSLTPEKNEHEPEEIRFMCGDSGTEFFIMHRGDTIRFRSGMAAFAPRLQPVTPGIGYVDDPSASPLTRDNLTSWASFLPGAGHPAIAYVSQPKGFNLFAPLAETDSLLSPSIPSILLPEANPPFIPLASYADAELVPFTKGECPDTPDIPLPQRLCELEARVVSPTRRKVLGASINQCARLLHAADAEERTVATPSGLTATLLGSRWTAVNLARLQGECGNRLWFENPSPQLVEALQTNDLFLVVSDPRHLGVPDALPGASAFHDRLSLLGWTFESGVGQSPGYGDYAGIMILKGRTGKLYDPADEKKTDGKPFSLVANVDHWTRRDLFSSPGGDPSQQILLSEWLVSYFKEAFHNADHENFGHFCGIASDPSWTGILFLRVPLSRSCLPRQMKGILHGTGGEPVYIHHWGVGINSARQKGLNVEQDESAALFGLIHYTDPHLKNGPVEPVPASSGDYDFKLLMLHVLFRDSCVKTFQCYSQLTLGRLLSMPVDRMDEGGNAYRAVLMQGICQDREGDSVFLLNAVSPCTFLMKNGIVESVTLSGVEMLSLDSGGDDILFSLEGTLGFSLIRRSGEEAQPPALDLYSYGGVSGSHHTGLAWTGGGLRLRCTGETPNWTVEDRLIPVPFKSKPRPGSLAAALHLIPDSFLTGDGENTPEKAGFASMRTGCSLGGVGNASWTGFTLHVNMGTLGELASRAGLSAKILLAWSNEPAGNAQAGGLWIKMPGAGGEGILLQNILKLTTGAVSLGFDDEKQAYFLLIDNIALSILGIAKLPSNGNTRFYLFGAASENEEENALGWYSFYKHK